MMDRRTFVKVIGAELAVAPLCARAQRSASPVVGFLSSRAAQGSAVHAAAFRQGLGETGYIEGQNIAITYRWAEGRYERLPALVRELLDLRVGAIVAVGGAPSALAAKAATSTVPIILVIGDDPVALRLVASLNRPGANVTGVSFLTAELGAKRLGFILEMVPKATVVGLLLNPNNPKGEVQRQNVRRAAQALGRRLVVLHASAELDFAQSFATLAREGVGALVVENDAFFGSERTRLAALESRNRIPAIHHIREFPQAGSLMSYGANLAEAYRRAGAYTGQILNGASPNDLPVEQPTKFELVINTTTAKKLGLTIPQSLLLQADELIQ
jgi:putative ABC transport system substrate-binding protein